MNMKIHSKKKKPRQFKMQNKIFKYVIVLKNSKTDIITMTPNQNASKNR